MAVAVLILPADALSVKELPAAVPAEPAVSVTVAAESVTLVIPVDVAERVGAVVDETETPPAPPAAVRLAVVRTPVVVTPPLTAERVIAVVAVSALCRFMEPLFEVRLSVGALRFDAPLASEIVVSDVMEI